MGGVYKVTHPLVKIVLKVVCEGELKLFFCYNFIYCKLVCVYNKRKKILLDNLK